MIYFILLNLYARTRFYCANDVVTGNTAQLPV